MKIDFSKQILTIDEQPMTRSNVDDTKVDLAWVCVTALLADSEGSIDDKTKAFALAQRVLKGGEQDISPEEAASIKVRVNAAYKNVTLVARAAALLNG